MGWNSCIWASEFGRDCRVGVVSAGRLNHEHVMQGILTAGMRRVIGTQAEMISRYLIFCLMILGVAIVANMNRIFVTTAGNLIISHAIYRIQRIVRKLRHAKPNEIWTRARAPLKMHNCMRLPLAILFFSVHAASANPTATSIAPTAAYVGSTITVTGTDFINSVCAAKVGATPISGTEAACT